MGRGILEEKEIRTISEWWEKQRAGLEGFRIAVLNLPQPLSVFSQVNLGAKGK